jgi:tight adherence protein C
MEILASVLIFLGIVSFAASLCLVLRLRKSHEIVSKIKENIMEVREADEGLGRVMGKLMELALSLGKFMKPKNQKEASKIRGSLMKGGFRRDSALTVFYGIKLMAGAVLGSAFFLAKIFLFIHMPFYYFLFFIIVFFALGFYLPDIFLKMRIESRKRQISEYFPDALDLMVVCVEAGMGLDSAINRVGEELKFSNKVLSDEFRLLSLELRAGKPRKEALKSLASRVDLEDVTSLVTLLIQTDKFGTKVAQALRVYSDSMRTKRQQRAEEIASKLPIKLVFPLVLFIFPSLFITILGPALIQLYRNVH